MTVFCRLVVLLMSAYFAIGSRIAITNNGYDDIVIGISPDVPESNASSILSNIQATFKAASPILYEATQNRSYFRSVRILVPKSWTTVNASASTWETFSDADIQVASPNGRYGYEPYTVQPGGCGDPGLRIHLTPYYINNYNSSEMVTNYGRPEKLLVLQWAHLRYGVFEEHGSSGDDKYPIFYRPQSSTPSRSQIPNICTDGDLQFSAVDSNNGENCRQDSETGLYDSNCVLSFPPDYKPEISLMSHNSKLQSMVHFCDDSNHNREAPNKHNALCGTRSVWSIITQNADFANNKNPSRDIETLDPRFQIVRESSARFVLVLDVSGSMSSYDRIGRLNRSARRWITYDLPNSSQLAIVTFESQVATYTNMTVINDNSRPILASELPNYADGGTCIGCGLKKALELLAPTGKGGVIVLMTDGEENAYPYIQDVLPDIIAAEVRVVSIAFGTEATTLIENLASQTNGKSYFILDNGTTDGLNDAFTESLTYQPSFPMGDMVVELFQETYVKNISSSNSLSTFISERFSIDETIGRQLTLRIEYGPSSNISSSYLTAANGSIYNNMTYDNNSNVAFIVLAEAQVGDWSFNLNVTIGSSDFVTVTVTAQARSDSRAPIKTECRITNGPIITDPNVTPVKIIAMVFQGNNPVIGAKVRAYIEKPDLTIDTVDLDDNGVLADSVADDGIYSRNYVTINSAGRYSLQCQVWDDGSAYINDGFIANSFPVDGLPSFRTLSSAQPTATGNFTRFAVGGAFQADKAVNASACPPSRVVDLRIAAMSVSNNSVTVEWTAPGGLLDSGTVDRYQLKYSLMFDRLNGTNFSSEINSTLLLLEQVIAGSFSPQPVGKKQSVTFSLPSNISQDTTYFFGLQSINAQNQTSLSNIASTQITIIPKYSSSSSKLDVNGIVCLGLAYLVLSAIPS